mgnify:CR=1 FL=1
MNEPVAIPSDDSPSHSHDECAECQTLHDALVVVMNNHGALRREYCWPLAKCNMVTIKFDRIPLCDEEIDQVMLYLENSRKFLRCLHPTVEDHAKALHDHTEPSQGGQS